MEPLKFFFESIPYCTNDKNKKKNNLLSVSLSSIALYKMLEPMPLHRIIIWHNKHYFIIWCVRLWELYMYMGKTLLWWTDTIVYLPHFLNRNNNKNTRQYTTQQIGFMVGLKVYCCCFSSNGDNFWGRKCLRTIV